MGVVELLVGGGVYYFLVEEPTLRLLSSPVLSSVDTGKPIHYPVCIVTHVADIHYKSGKSGGDGYFGKKNWRKKCVNLGETKIATKVRKS